MKINDKSIDALRSQAESGAGLSPNDTRELIDELRRVQAQCAILQSELAFYANPLTWDDRHAKDGIWSKALVDKGKRARDALGLEETPA